MIDKKRRLACMSLGALFLLTASTMVAAPASAAAVDLSLTLRDADASCRIWKDGDQAMWNFTLVMNGTDTSAITTPTYVWIDDTGAPAMRADSWVTILTASGDVLSNPPAYYTGDSNVFQTGAGTYTPLGGLDIALFGAAHGAPVTNVTVILTPNSDSENKNHYFNVTARTHRSGIPDITRKVTVCVYVPPKPRFDMGNTTDLLQAAADSNITVTFWLKNTGNTQDYYFCNVTVPREDWTFNFTQGVNRVGSSNITNLTNIGQNVTIRVKVYVPREARAKENSTVSVNCTSFKALSLGKEIFVYPPYTRIEVIQYYYISAKIPPGSLSTIAGVPGDKLTFNFLVQNLGNGPDQGTARIVTGNLSWDALVTPGDFDLATKGDSGADQTAQFIVTIPDKTLIFTYDFTINVTSVVNNTPVTSLRFHVQVQQVYVPIVSPVAPKTGSPSEEVVFNFTIRNGGNGLDNLVIEVFNLTDWRVFLSPPVGKKLLQVNEEYGFQATVIVPKDLTKAQVGNYSQTIRVSSEYAQLDHGALIYQQVVLTVVILPKVSCGLAPALTVKELNPFAFPDGIAKANFLLALSNTGNGHDSVTVTATYPAGFNVTLRPPDFQLDILQTKAALVEVEAPPALPSGEYVITVVARSNLLASASCTAVYRLTAFHLDGQVSPSIALYIQSPDHPKDDITTPLNVNSTTQVEGFFIKFHVTIENKGDRAIAANSATVIAYDTLECERAPINAKHDTCGNYPAFNWTNPNFINAGGSAFFEWHYFAPEYLCFNEEICHRTDPPPPANSHKIRFVLTLPQEAVTTNNEGQVTVGVLPATVLLTPGAAAQFPYLPVGAGVGVAGLVGFAYWYRFVRKPKVDEDLYASIYGAQGAPEGHTQSVGEYFATQQPPAEVAQQVPSQYQGMTDEQLEEARRIYGDNYGR